MALICARARTQGFPAFLDDFFELFHRVRDIRPNGSGLCHLRAFINGT
jgi:hypothetical protein